MFFFFCLFCFVLRNQLLSFYVIYTFDDGRIGMIKEKQKLKDEKTKDETAFKHDSDKSI